MTLPARCMSCFGILPPQANFCPRCGKPVPASVAALRDSIRICPGCKRDNAADAAFCESCGLKLPERAAPAMPVYGAVPPAAPATPDGGVTAQTLTPAAVEPVTPDLPAEDWAVDQSLLPATQHAQPPSPATVEPSAGLATQADSSWGAPAETPERTGTQWVMYTEPAQRAETAQSISVTEAPLADAETIPATTPYAAGQPSAVTAPPPLPQHPQTGGPHTYRPMMREAYCPRCGTFKPANSTQCANCGMPFSQVNYDGVPDAVSQHGTPARFWRRVCAFILDGVIMVLAGTLIWLAFGANFWEAAPLTEYTDANGTLITVSVTWYVYLGFFVYNTAFLAIWGTTPAKRLLNIYVYSPSGRPRPGVLRALFRTLVAQLTANTIMLLFLVVAFRRDKRGLHDLITGTFPTYREPR